MLTSHLILRKGYSDEPGAHFRMASRLPFIRYDGFVASLTVRRRAMLNWSLTFLVVAIIAAILGLGGLAGLAAEIAKVLFVVFLILFLVSLVTGRKAP
jgi:uncharacterized membrane protein YtjA (UPF0391 family)